MCETSYKLEHRSLSLTSQDLVLVEWPSPQKCTMMIVNSNTKSVLLQLEDEYLQQRYDGSLVELVRDSLFFTCFTFFECSSCLKTFSIIYNNKKLRIVQWNLSLYVCVCVCGFCKLQLVTIKLGTRILSLLREQFGSSVQWH